MRMISVVESDCDYLERLKKEYHDILDSDCYMSYYMFQRFDYVKREIRRLEKLCVE